MERGLYQAAYCGCEATKDHTEVGSPLASLSATCDSSTGEEATYGCSRRGDNSTYSDLKLPLHFV